jgi:hypothetical protein
VLRMHRDANAEIDNIDVVQRDLVDAATLAWDNAVRDGEEYGVRNSARIQPYHRLDLSGTYTRKPDNKDKRFHSSWVFSVYNIYNRRNPFFIYYDLSTDAAAGTAQAKAIRVSLFPVIPSVTWNFSWKGK